MCRDRSRFHPDRCNRSHRGADGRCCRKVRQRCDRGRHQHHPQERQRRWRRHRDLRWLHGRRRRHPRCLRQLGVPARAEQLLQYHRRSSQPRPEQSQRDRRARRQPRQPCDVPGFEHAQGAGLPLSRRRRGRCALRTEVAGAQRRLQSPGWRQVLQLRNLRLQERQVISEVSAAGQAPLHRSRDRHHELPVPVRLRPARSEQGDRLFGDRRRQGANRRLELGPQQHVRPRPFQRLYPQFRELGRVQQHRCADAARLLRRLPANDAVDVEPGRRPRFRRGTRSPLNVAYGLEYRRGSYGIGAGVPLSWLDGGAQSFPGFMPTDAGTHYRHVEGAYIDVAAQPIGPLHPDAAARFEHFSDFGSAAIGALTARYDFNPRFAVRGTISNGFRAPTLAEEYFSSTNVTPTTAFVQLPPNSAGGKVIGLGDGLRPARSMNYSVGFVWRPLPAVLGTLDLYVINLTNRIVATGNLIGTLNGVTQPAAPAINAAIAANGNQLDPAVLATGSTGVTLFANGIDTRTRGADVAFDFPSHYAFGDIDWSIGANFNLTEITRVPATPAQLAGATLYDAAALSDLTTASPRYVLKFGALWTEGRLAVNAVEQVYGESSEWENDDGDNASNTPEYFQSTIGVTPITNLDVSYRLTSHFTASIGALNLFNRYPDKYNSTLLAHYDDFRFGDTLGVFQYPMFSPFGIDGGYYYVRATFHW
ncbi:MAG TPA: TonB-dependent receptor [Rhodanobacteraceae bacterium]